MEFPFELMPQSSRIKQSAECPESDWAFRTVSEEVVCVISGMLPIQVLAAERQALYWGRRSSMSSPGELKTEERQHRLCRWQAQWDTAETGRWIYHLIPQINAWLNRQRGELNYYLTQLTWPDMAAFRHIFIASSKMILQSARPGVTKDAEYVLFACPRYNTQRADLEIGLNQKSQLEALVGAMLSLKAVWNATNTFAKEVLKDLRSIERRRMK